VTDTSPYAPDGGNLPLQNDCEHHYASEIRGGHPMHVRICTLCQEPDWADLDEQAAEMYRKGWEAADDRHATCGDVTRGYGAALFGPCILERSHAGPHQDVNGTTWIHRPGALEWAMRQGGKPYRPPAGPDLSDELAAARDRMAAPDDEHRYTTPSGNVHRHLGPIEDCQLRECAGRRQPAYDAVYAYIATLPGGGYEATVRNAHIWRGVTAALAAQEATQARLRAALKAEWDSVADSTRRARHPETRHTLDGMAAGLDIALHLHDQHLGQTTNPTPPEVP